MELRRMEEISACSRRAKFRLYVTRDVLMMFVLVQAIVLALGEYDAEMLQHKMSSPPS